MKNQLQKTKEKVAFAANKKMLAVIAAVLLSSLFRFQANAQCVVGFTYVVNGNTVDFTNTSTGTFNLIQWDFYDGNYSNALSPSHTYLGPGTYYVCLTIEDTMGACFGQTCQNVVVGASVCTADFSFTVTGLTVDFTNTSTGSYSISSWDFDDGNTSSDTNPTYTYVIPGTYNVCLFISDTGGNCNNTFCANVTVTSPVPTCLASYFYQQISGGDYQFTNTSLASGPATYAWDFGDGGTSTAIDTVHTFANTGVYNVCVQVTVQDSSGICQDDTCISINVIITNVNEHASFMPGVVKIFPNPATDILNISIVSGRNEDAVLLLTDFSGRVIKTKNIAVSAGDNHESFVLNDLARGIYFIQVKSPNTFAHQRFTVIR